MDGERAAVRETGEKLYTGALVVAYRLTYISRYECVSAMLYHSALNNTHLYRYFWVVDIFLMAT